MGKSSYIGSGTIIKAAENGTIWVGSVDPAGSASSGSSKTISQLIRDDNKAPSDKDIKAQLEIDNKSDKKEIRSFVSQCALAHTKGELTAEKPNPPSSIRKRIINSGGNINWLSSNKVRQHSFHKSICRFINEEITFNMIWID